MEENYESSMKNYLFTDILRVLNENNKKEEDIEWIGYNKICYIDNLDKVKDITKNKIYCGSFQSNSTYKIWCLPSALVIVGKDFFIDLKSVVPDIEGAYYLRFNTGSIDKPKESIKIDDIFENNLYPMIYL